MDKLNGDTLSHSEDVLNSALPIAQLLLVLLKGFTLGFISLRFVILNPK